MIDELNTQIAQLHSRQQDLSSLLMRLGTSRLPTTSKEIQTRSISKVLNDVKMEIVDLTVKRDTLIQQEEKRS